MIIDRALYQSDVVRFLAATEPQRDRATFGVDGRRHRVSESLRVPLGYTVLKVSQRESGKGKGIQRNPARF